MPTPLSTLPPVTPLSAESQLSFTEFQRVTSQLVQRDRVLEEAVVNFMSAASLVRTANMLAAMELILGTDLTEQTIAAGALPAGYVSFQDFQNDIESRVSTLEQGFQVTSPDGTTTQSLKSLSLSNQANIAALQQQLDQFNAAIAAAQALTSQIASIAATVASVDSRLATIEAVQADQADELKNARKEFAQDPSKRLVDKIDSMDSISEALQTNMDAVTKEVTDARAPDRFDSLAEHIGSIEASIQDLNDSLSQLQGRGAVTGVKVGRSILHSNVELIPGSNIALTRERNGIRIDVVDKATCIDTQAPIGDPNSACCGPGSVTIGN